MTRVGAAEIHREGYSPQKEIKTYKSDNRAQQIPAAILLGQQRSRGILQVSGQTYRCSYILVVSVSIRIEYFNETVGTEGGILFWPGILLCQLLSVKRFFTVSRLRWQWRPQKRKKSTEDHTPAKAIGFPLSSNAIAALWSFQDSPPDSWSGIRPK